jgi:hypothetical protein
MSTAVSAACPDVGKEVRREKAERVGGKDVGTALGVEEGVIFSGVRGAAAGAVNDVFDLSWVKV